MLIFLNSLLIIISILCFLVGYVFLNNKAENILMWRLTGKAKQIRDIDGYKKHQGRYSIIMGIMFILVPFSIYIFNKFDINKALFKLWYVVLAGVMLLNAFKTRKYFK